MISLKRLFYISHLDKLRLKTVVYVALFWTVVDLVVLLLRSDEPDRRSSLLFRECLMMSVSLIMSYIFVYQLRRMSRRFPLWLNFLFKSLILLGSAFLLTFIVQFTNATLVKNESVIQALDEMQSYVLYKNWLLEKIIFWMAMFFITQLILIINEKYSAGVFLDILVGRYINPKVENRIVMFMDLKDSTPIAEKLGHALYFEFIRDFIYRVSQAIIEFEGTIYQYVGDEVVCSWPLSQRNARRCLDVVIESRKNIQKRSEVFRRKYDIVPEFRVGIHVGKVTIGEIGVLKKDLAMSGDVMNTTARIRSACNELHHNFIVSKDYMEYIDLKGWQAESLGEVELKGKGSTVGLFQLRI